MNRIVSNQLYSFSHIAERNKSRQAMVNGTQGRVAPLALQDGFTLKFSGKRGNNPFAGKENHLSQLNLLRQEKERILGVFEKAQDGLRQEKKEKLGETAGLYPQEGLLSLALVEALQPALRQFDEQLDERVQYLESIHGKKGAILGGIVGTGMTGAALLVEALMANPVHFFQTLPWALSIMMVGGLAGHTVEFVQVSLNPKYKDWSPVGLQVEGQPVRMLAGNINGELALKKDLTALKEKVELSLIANSVLPELNEQEQEILSDGQRAKLIENQEIHKQLMELIFGA